jgi:hypothetical protein
MAVLMGCLFVCSVAILVATTRAPAWVPRLSPG